MKNNVAFKCQLCDQEAYKNANGIVRHILKCHIEVKIEDYFKTYINEETFASIAAKKVRDSKLPIKERLTEVCLECKLHTCNFESFGKGFVQTHDIKFLALRRDYSNTSCLIWILKSNATTRK